MIREIWRKRGIIVGVGSRWQYVSQIIAVSSPKLTVTVLSMSKTKDQMQRRSRRWSDLLELQKCRIGAGPVSILEGKKDSSFDILVVETDDAGR